MTSCHQIWWDFYSIWCQNLLNLVILWPYIAHQNDFARGATAPKCVLVFGWSQKTSPYHIRWVHNNFCLHQKIQIFHFLILRSKMIWFIYCLSIKPERNKRLRRFIKCTIESCLLQDLTWLGFEIDFRFCLVLKRYSARYFYHWSPSINLFALRVIGFKCSPN